MSNELLPSYVRITAMGKTRPTQYNIGDIISFREVAGPLKKYRITGASDPKFYTADELNDRNEVITKNVTIGRDLVKGGARKVRKSRKSKKSKKSKKATKSRRLF